MDGSPAEQVINELFPYFEALETRSAAILQLLKDKGLTTDEEFAHYLEQAANGSNVKWLAARIRVERLLSSALKEDKDASKAEKTKAEPTAGKKTTESGAEENTEKSTAKSAEPDTGKAAEKPTDKDPGKTAERDDEKPDKNTAQEESGDDVAKGSHGHPKETNAGSGVNTGTKQNAGKAAK